MTAKRQNLRTRHLDTCPWRAWLSAFMDKVPGRAATGLWELK